MLIEYLEDEFEQPLFDIKQGNGKMMRDQHIPQGWRLAEESDVEKDKQQVLAMYKPHEVVWTRKVHTRRPGVSAMRVNSYRTKEVTTTITKMNYGPAQVGLACDDLTVESVGCTDGATDVLL